MSIFKATCEATGVVTVSDPDDPSAEVQHLVMSEPRADAYSTGRTIAGEMPAGVIRIDEGHVSADTDDVDGFDAKVFVSITLFLEADDEEAANDLANGESVVPLLKDVAEKMGVTFDMDDFECHDVWAPAPDPAPTPSI